jgi:flagellar FliJ protein
MAGKRTFTFRLQRLLEIRELRERQEQQKLLVLMTKLQQEVDALTVMQDEEAALEDRMTIKPGEKLDIEDRVATARALETKRQQMRQQEKRIDAAEAEVAQQREVLKQARIAVKALEKLRERQLEEFREEVLREQAVFLDDISTQGFLRQRNTARRNAAEDLGLDETDIELIEAAEAALLED